MWGAIIGAALSAAGNITGGITGAEAARKKRQLLEQRKRENQDWFDKKRYQDPTQFTSAQRVLTRMEDYLKNRGKSISGSAAVTGASNATVAAQKEIANNAMADAYANVAAQGEARQDAIEEQYRNQKRAIEDAEIGMAVDKANNTAHAVNGLASAAGSLASAIDIPKEDIPKEPSVTSGASETTPAMPASTELGTSTGVDYDPYNNPKL